MADRASKPRQNACRACTRAKRACDRRIPQCGRCGDRGLQCQYFPRSRRSDRPVSLAPRPQAAILDQLYLSNPPVGAGHERVIGNGPLALAAPAELSQSQPALNVFQHRLQSQLLASAISPPHADPDLSWFLAQDSWNIESTFIPSPADSTFIFRGSRKAMRNWLKDWAKRGHNIFIHKNLYQSELPLCLEDAYTALTAYLAKTEETEDMVLRIIENRAASLHQQQSLMLEGFERLDLMSHLSRTQALLIYTLIRLVDGSPRQRALGEASFSTLDQWCQEMRDAALTEAPRLYETLGQLRSSDVGAGSGRAEFAVWQAWILSESMRRTWMLVSGTFYVYHDKTNGWPGCSGFLMFTTRQGLWEAPNAWRWVQQVREQNPLFQQSVNLPGLMEDTSPAEIDSFTNQLLSILLSPEDMTRWATRTAQIEG